MSYDHNDIYNIVERLAILEGRITPTTVKHGLNKQQKSVPQLPALFKPKHISVLGSKTDPEHPMKGYAVGDDIEDERRPVEEGIATEDVLEKVKKSFTDSGSRFVFCKMSLADATPFTLLSSNLILSSLATPK